MKPSCYPIAPTRRNVDPTQDPRLTVALALLACVAFSRPVFADPGQHMEDPLFGLGFDPAEVQFQQLDALPCAAGGDQFPPYLVFAYARKGDTAAWILNHSVPTGGDGPGQEHTEPAHGIVLKQSKGECMLVATPDAPEQHPAAVEPRLARALYRDAARRYIGAYKGADAFTAALAAASSRGCIDLAPALREALVRALVAPPPECSPLSRAAEDESGFDSAVPLSAVAPTSTAAAEARPSDCDEASSAAESTDPGAASKFDTHDQFEATATEILERYYRSYLSRLASPTASGPELRFSAALSQQIAENLELCKRYADGICGFGTDGDPYLDGQEYEVPLDVQSANLQVREVRPGWVEVSLNIYPSAADTFYDRRIAYTMIWQAGTWVVDDIFYSGVSVRQRMQNENADLLGAQK